MEAEQPTAALGVQEDAEERQVTIFIWEVIMKRLILGLMLILWCAAPAQATMTGNELLGHCNLVLKQSDESGKITPEESVSIFYCVGYLSGFIDSIQISTAIQNPKKPFFCAPPNGVENDQLARITVKWLKNHPENLHKTARVEVLFALTDAFPCPK